MKKAWLKDGKILINDDRQVILCEKCPCIRGCDNVPSIVTTPPGGGQVGVEYEYDAAALDADLPGDDFHWDLLEKPAGATVTDSGDSPSKGLVRWTPTEAGGPFFFTLRATDDCGNFSGEQRWPVFVD